MRHAGCGMRARIRSAAALGLGGEGSRLGLGEVVFWGSARASAYDPLESETANLNMPCSIPSGTLWTVEGDRKGAGGRKRFSIQWEECVVKLLRVHGECLGAKRR